MKFDKFDFNKFEFEFAVGSSYALKTKQSTESRSSSLLRAQSFNSRSLAVAGCHCGQRGHHSFAHQARFRARWEAAVSRGSVKLRGVRQQTVSCPVGPGRNEAIPDLQYWRRAANFRIGFWHSSFDLLRFVLSQVFNLRKPRNILKRDPQKSSHTYIPLLSEMAH